MSTSKPPTLEIEQSPLRLLGLIALAIVMTLLSLSIALGWIGDAAPGGFATFIGWIGTLLFGAAGAIGAWRLAVVRGPVLFISPAGFRDTRIAPETIPWTAVLRIGTWQFKGQKILILVLDPQTEASLTLTPIARWTRSANAQLQADGLCISASGLNIDYETLRSACIAHLQAAHGHGGQRL